MSHLISYWPILLILLLVVAIFIVLHTHITFTIIYTQANERTHIRVGAKALNKIVNIGLKTLYQTENKVMGDTLVDETSKSNPLYSWPSISELIHIYKRIVRKRLKHMVCEEFKWDTQVGVNDPMGSALLTGTLWGLKGYIIGLVSSKIKFNEKANITVQPLYNHIHFNTALTCRLKVSVRQALFLSIIIVWHLSKAKRKKKKLAHKISQVV